MNAPLRRGACPALSQPMRTGDGLLVRLTPTGTTMPCEAFAALCTAARNCGNGVIEITSRGSIQIRGLTEASVKSFAAAVAGIDLAFGEGPPAAITRSMRIAASTACSAATAPMGVAVSASPPTPT